MMPVRSEQQWLYSQIYFLHPDQGDAVEPLALRAVCDQFVLEVIPNLVSTFQEQRWIEQFFFIRYAEGGYHLRLRFQGEAEYLDGPVRAQLETAVADFFAAQQAPLWPAGTEITADTLLESGCLRYATYEPEIDKYGGPAGLAVAEAHFQVSSEICMLVLAAEQQTNISRSQFALELMDILLSEFGADPHEKAFLLRAYTAY
ncbi:MAG: thiopeptide-type bacteriocin biosynthesis protein, partial [Anaerolineales bacterium]|nr:thiopeptide-type bacteriocin biosynthesis protein [Anaerolineales bacterium]